MAELRTELRGEVNIDARFDGVDTCFAALDHKLDAQFSRLTNIVIFSTVGLGGTVLVASAILRSLFG